MKATGITRRMDDLGRVVIPKELRRTMSIGDGDPMEIFVDGDFIMLRRYNVAVSMMADLQRIHERIEDLNPETAQQADALIKQLAAVLSEGEDVNP